VQTEWLHNFLLDPYPIRPAVVLRMPRFNMSPDEATKLVNYFAAKDNVEFPYTFSQRRRTDHLWPPKRPIGEADGGTWRRGTPEGARFRDAMRIVTNSELLRAVPSRWRL
jgi:hypothetical protein